MTHFNKAFIGLRTQNGFKTAYNFYHSNGGRRVFPFTYAHYLKIERGGCLPQPPALTIMLKLLRKTILPHELQELMRAYLRDLCGDSAAYDELFAPLLVRPEAPAPASALPLALGRLAVNMTPKQFKGIVASPEATGCYMLLSNVPTALTAGQIAAAVGIPEAAVFSALKELTRRKLLVRQGGDRFKRAVSPDHSWRVPNSHGLESLYDQMEKNVDALAGTRSRSQWSRSTAVRLRTPALCGWVSAVEDAFNLSLAYSQKMMPLDPETPVYYLEASLRRLASFSSDKNERSLKTTNK